MSLNKGRKPISEKPTQRVISPEEVFGNSLKLDPELEAELDAKGLEGRFVDYKKLVEFAGYHKHGWTPYKRDISATIGSADFKFGADPDGLVRRGTVVLAVKPKEKVQIHRDFLKQKAQKYSQSNKNLAQEMRDYVRRDGSSAEVLEGWDSNE